MASPSPLSQANTSFCVALLKKLGDDDNTANVFFSPFSISSALAMVLLGTEGNTKKQMLEVMRATDLKDEIHSSFGQLLETLNKAGEHCSLNVANRLYGEQSYTFVEDFLVNTKKYYNAELEAVDFISNFEAARLHINEWVKNKTEGKITDLLAKGILTTITRLVLVNAIYFKGTWDNMFKEDLTRDAMFRVNKNKTKPVKMMHKRAEFPLIFIPEAQCQILEMPYKGKNLSMLIFLPTDIEDSSTGLEKLEELLTYENFAAWTRADMMDVTVVEVSLPVFKLEEKYDMKSVLKSMGMIDAFDIANSDFSGMSPANDLVLSEVVHKAFVEVNERGTEASASTEAEVTNRVIPRFRADHPFLFFIRHNCSNTILFAGRFCSPE